MPCLNYIAIIRLKKIWWVTSGKRAALYLKPLLSHWRTAKELMSKTPVGPLVEAAVGPTTLPLVGLQWAADLLLSGR